MVASGIGKTRDVRQRYCRGGAHTSCRILAAKRSGRSVRATSLERLSSSIARQGIDHQCPERSCSRLRADQRVNRRSVETLVGGRPISATFSDAVLSAVKASNVTRAANSASCVLRLALSDLAFAGTRQALDPDLRRYTLFNQILNGRCRLDCHQGACERGPGPGYRPDRAGENHSACFRGNPY